MPWRGVHRVQLRHKFTSVDALLLLADSSLYAARNTSPLQIVIKADVTPRRSDDRIGFTGPPMLYELAEFNRGTNKPAIWRYYEWRWTSEPVQGQTAPANRFLSSDLPSSSPSPPLRNALKNKFSTFEASPVTETAIIGRIEKLGVSDGPCWSECQRSTLRDVHDDTLSDLFSRFDRERCETSRVEDRHSTTKIEISSKSRLSRRLKWRLTREGIFVLLSLRRLRITLYDSYGIFCRDVFHFKGQKFHFRLTMLPLLPFFFFLVLSLKKSIEQSAGKS